MRYRVEKRVTQSGGVGIGAVWELIGTYGRRAVAETVAKRVRIDEHSSGRLIRAAADKLVRVVERPR